MGHEALPYTLLLLRREVGGNVLWGPTSLYSTAPQEKPHGRCHPMGVVNEQGSQCVHVCSLMQPFTPHTKCPSVPGDMLVDETDTLGFASGGAHILVENFPKQRGGRKTPPLFTVNLKPGKELFVQKFVNDHPLLDSARTCVNTRPGPHGPPTSLRSGANRLSEKATKFFSSRWSSGKLKGKF